MSRAPSFCGVILAAGESSRMGTPKALLRWGRGTFLSGAIRALNTYCDLVIVVSGTNADFLRPVADSEAAYLVVNPDPTRGQFSSLQIGLQEVMNRGRDAAIITLIDRPPAKLETIAHLQDEFLNRAAAGIWAVVPEFKGAHGHPYVIGREMIGKYLAAPASTSARDIQHANQKNIAYLPVDDPFVTLNIDTPEDYDRLNNSPPEPVVSR